MANRVQLSGPKEAEKYVLHMVSKSINVREYRRGNQKWTIQRHWQHWVHKTPDEDK